MFFALPGCHCCSDSLQVNKLHSNLFSRCSIPYGKTIWDCMHFLKPVDWLQMTAPGWTDYLKVKMRKRTSASFPGTFLNISVWWCCRVGSNRSANWESWNNILSLEESTYSWFTEDSIHKPELQQCIHFWRSVGITEGSHILKERGPIFAGSISVGTFTK